MRSDLSCVVTHLVGVAGFEPANDRVKVCCLTAWLYPNIDLNIISQKEKKFNRSLIFYFVLTVVVTNNLPVLLQFDAIYGII